MDPLLLLRKQLKKATTTVSLHDHDGNIVTDLSQCIYMKLGPFIFPRDQSTNFRSKRGTGDFYTLDAVWFCHLKRDASYGEYIQEARRMAVGTVSVVDKRELLAYLDGDMSPGECSHVDTTASLPKPRRSFKDDDEGIEEEEEKEKEEEEEEEEEEGKEKRRERDMKSKGPEGKEREIGVGKTLEPLSVEERSSTRHALWDKVNIRPARARDSVLVCSRDFSDTLTIAQEVLKSLGGPTPSLQPPPTTTEFITGKRRPTAISLIEQIAHANQPVERESQVGETFTKKESRIVRDKASQSKNIIPIIIVPAAPTALLTMLNVVSFLEDGVYISLAEAKAKGNTKSNNLTFEHRFISTFTHGERTMRFQVIDNPLRLSLEDWNRVVAVFIHGGAGWQFKGWKWDSPSDVFQFIRGFSLEWDDGPIDKKVASWNVKRLVINRIRRHADATAVHQFWSILEQFLIKKNFL